MSEAKNYITKGRQGVPVEVMRFYLGEGKTVSIECRTESEISKWLGTEEWPHNHGEYIVLDTSGGILACTHQAFRNDYIECPPSQPKRSVDDCAINQINMAGNNIGEFVDTFLGAENVDQRWLAIARTDLQKGFMALVRAVAKPEGF